MSPLLDLKSPISKTFNIFLYILTVTDSGFITIQLLMSLVLSLISACGIRMIKVAWCRCSMEKVAIHNM